MAERARFVGTITDDNGDIIPAATIEVRQAGTSTKITETIFSADDPATGEHSNPFTSNANGRVEFYLTDHKRCDLFVSKTGFTSQTIPVDVQKSGLGMVAADTIWDAAGDLVHGTGADTGARLALGTAGQVLKVNAGATAPEWGAESSTTGDLLDWQFARKTADESVTSSTTLQDDDHLVIALGANQVWLIEAYISVIGDLTGDIQVGFVVPASSTLRWSGHGPDTAQTDPGNTNMRTDGATVSDTAKAYGTTSGGNIGIFIKGLVATAGTSGNLQFRWAQATSDATASTVQSQSWLLARRVA